MKQNKTNPCVVEAVTETTMTVAAGKNSSTPDFVTWRSFPKAYK